MKDLRNISGILPAQCRTNPNDCGIAWSEHRSQPIQRPRKAGIKLHVACDSAEISAVYDKAISAIEAFKKAMTETLKPIDPQTIQVGDTVRLVGGRSKQEFGYPCLEIGKDYKVVDVDELEGDGMYAMRVCIECNTVNGRSWIYDEDLVLVESA